LTLEGDPLRQKAGGGNCLAGGEKDLLVGGIHSGVDEKGVVFQHKPAPMGGQKSRSHIEKKRKFWSAAGRKEAMVSKKGKKGRPGVKKKISSSRKLHSKGTTREH